MTNVETYWKLVFEARTRPLQFRTGIEARIRKVWKTMTEDERFEIESACS